jgi:beta-RFAP synthase
MAESVIVSAPARLHFGLLRFARAEGRSFGGLGLMIDFARAEVRLTAASRWTATGPRSDLAETIARRVLREWGPPDAPPALAVEIRHAGLRHQGLGSGTQLALAVAAGTRALCQLPQATAAELASVARRGKRSAVGSHGFLHGGLIWEQGRLPHQTLADLTDRVELPAAWRVVLATPTRNSPATGSAGLHGRAETEAFGRLPAPPEAKVLSLENLVQQTILPAARNADFTNFAASIHEYGSTAGTFFSKVQGGTYASPAVAARVEALGALGVVGVGQSSWGPAVFAFTASKCDAQALTRLLVDHPCFQGCRLDIIASDNRGAQLQRESTANRPTARR